MGAIRLLFLFPGRIGRAKFWFGFLLAKVILIGGVIGGVMTFKAHPLVSAYIPYVSLVYFWILIAISIKRLHDMNARAWWVLLMLPLPLGLGMIGSLARIQVLQGLAFITSICVLGILGAVAGTQGDNRFGADPLAHKRL